MRNKIRETDETTKKRTKNEVIAFQRVTIKTNQTLNYGREHQLEISKSFGNMAATNNYFNNSAD